MAPTLPKQVIVNSATNVRDLSANLLSKYGFCTLFSKTLKASMRETAAKDSGLGPDYLPMCGSSKTRLTRTPSPGRYWQGQAATTHPLGCAACALRRSSSSCSPRQQPPWTRGTKSTTAADTGRASCWTRLEEMLIVFSLLVRKLGCPVSLSTAYLCLMILGATPYGTVCCWNTHNVTWKCVISVSWH